MKENLRRGGKPAGRGGGRHGADRPGASLAEAGAAGGHYSFPAQHCRRQADAGAAGRGYGVLRAGQLSLVDVEGGTVDRLRDALAPMPSARAVAEAAQFEGGDLRSATLSQRSRKDGAPLRGGLAREHGELVAQGVKAFGFNTTLAPVLDLALPASAEVMGARAAASTAEGVVDYARGFLDGLATHGVVGCGKHFPGLGGGSLDSHLETPAIRRTLRELMSEDLVPYRELRKELPMIMVSHAAYPETPGSDRPASVSAYWITTLLRKQMSYRGHHLLRRSGDGRHFEIHAHRRGCHCGDPRGDGFAGNLPQPGADSARI